jgi:hypothetical protein
MCPWIETRSATIGLLPNSGAVPVTLIMVAWGAVPCSESDPLDSVSEPVDDAGVELSAVVNCRIDVWRE